VVSAIRADAGVAADSYRTEPVPLACPLHVFGAHDDPSATPAELEQWDLYEGVDLTLTLYPGDHFYLYADPGRLLADIASVLAVPPA
jgi:surfactin synthase thioesterase subunit